MHDAVVTTVQLLELVPPLLKVSQGGGVLVRCGSSMLPQVCQQGVGVHHGRAALLSLPALLHDVVPAVITNSVTPSFTLISFSNGGPLSCSMTGGVVWWMERGRWDNSLYS